MNWQLLDARDKSRADQRNAELKLAWAKQEAELRQRRRMALKGAGLAARLSRANSQEQGAAQRQVV